MKILLSILLFVFAIKAAAQPADFAIFDAKVYTADEKRPWASAITVRNGKISYVGSAEAAERYIDDQTEILSLPGLMVLPGFIDSHNHVFEGASNVGGNCELSKTANLSGQASYLNQCRKQVKKRGDWVIGYGFQLDALLAGNSTMTPRQMLDRYFINNPVVIMEESSHAMMVNSLALQKAGISASTKSPQGGRIMLDANGKPNGILFDNAGDIVMEMAWNAQNNRFNAGYDGLIAGMTEAAKNGITTIGDGRLYWQRGWFDIWLQAEADKALKQRVSVRPWIYPALPKAKQLKALSKMQSSNLQRDLIVNQVKLYTDGVLHFGTAKLKQPYDWSWQKDAPNGINYIPPDALPDWLSALNKIGYGAHIHAVGDAGINEALNAIENVRKQGSRQKYGLTHLELIAKNDLSRFARLKVDADFQAGAAFFAEHDWVKPLIGKTRAKHMLPMRKVFNTGANVTFSSDWTVNPLSPLVGIANSLREKHGQGLPDIHEAIYAYTLNGAQALGLEQVTGSIEVGKSADFVVLDSDITKRSPTDIEHSEILMTFYRGEVTFDSNTKGSSAFR